MGFKGRYNLHFDKNTSIDFRRKIEMKNFTVESEKTKLLEQKKSEIEIKKPLCFTEGKQ